MTKLRLFLLYSSLAVFISTAFLVYWKYKENNLASSGSGSSSKRAIDGRGVYMARYVESTLVSELFADRAHLDNPGILSLLGNVRLFRYLPQSIETSRSDTMRVTLNTKSIGELMNYNKTEKIRRVELEGDVTLKSAKGTISSEKITYTPRDQFVSSTVASTLKARGNHAFSENGFVLNLRTYDLRMNGPLKGVFSP